MAKIEIAKKEDLQGFATEEDLNGKADKNHTHSYNDLTDKPNIPNVDGFATEEDLNGKADANHTHSYNDLDDKPSIPSIDGLATTGDLSAMQDTIDSLISRIEALENDEG